MVQHVVQNCVAVCCVQLSAIDTTGYATEPDSAQTVPVCGLDPDSTLCDVDVLAWQSCAFFVVESSDVQQPRARFYVVLVRV